MPATDPDAGLTSFKRECKESTLRKLQAMRQLTDAIGSDKGIQFSDLIPLSSVMSAIVSKDRPAYHRAIAELRSCIGEKNESMTLQDLHAIAQINFLEGFDAFISYIYVGQPSTESDVNVQSPNSTIRDDVPIEGSMNQKRRAPKRLQVPKEEDVPTKKQTLQDQDEVQIIEEEPEMQMKPTRKSTLRVLDNGIKFNCAFNGCTEEFNTVEQLANHAEQCAHKSDQILVFRCSVCIKTFLSNKNIKNHIWSCFKCANATIKIACEKKEEKPRSSLVPMNQSMNVSMRAENQSLDCTVTNCNYSSVNPELLYNHVKNSHVGFNTSFKCLGCGVRRTSGKAINNHITRVCIDTQVEVEIHAKAETKADPIGAISASTNQWDVALNICPIQTCGFSGWSEQDISSHYKKDHSESRFSYECSVCKYNTNSIQSVKTHCEKVCAASHPEVLVNGNMISRRTPRARPSVQTPTSVVTKKRRGRPPKNSSMQGNVTKTEGGIADMPVLEMIDLEDDDDVMDVTRIRRNERREDSMHDDQMPIEEDLEVEEVIEVGDIFNTSQHGDSFDL